MMPERTAIRNLKLLVKHHLQLKNDISLQVACRDILDELLSNKNVKLLEGEESVLKSYFSIVEKELTVAYSRKILDR